MKLKKLLTILSVFIFMAFLLLPSGTQAEVREESESKVRKAGEKFKLNSDHYQRLVKNYSSFNALSKEKQGLVKNYSSFNALSKEKQALLKRLESEIMKLDSHENTRMLEVFQKFASWYETLKPLEKHRIENAEFPDARLVEIKKILTEQWIARLPKSESETLLKLDDKERRIQIIKIKQEEQARLNIVFDKKKKLAWTSEESRRFVAQIQAQFSSEQQEKFAKLENKKGSLLKMILEFAEENPPLPLNKSGAKYLSMKDLPMDMLVQLKKMKQAGAYKQFELARVEGKWPSYARVVTEILRKNDPSFTFDFGASNLNDFSLEAKNVIENALFPLLQDEEKEKLQTVAGRWPDYPMAIRELAKVHLIEVPGLSVPAELLQMKPGKLPMMMR